ncbi:MAG: bifunctional folylpolyglutamate synthase/dihydrofolate synthase [Pontiellaceae bacterium]|jgi:dihydrofolate synthase/folylpolyglutamate synthase|nr:bifunctional folylpolyglutamate synthase/dihydrofolate synthase [Pontiellaceae bacterium]
MSLDLEKSVASLFARTAYGIKPGLDVTRALLEKLGNPHEGLKCVHVAGTNGKGSVCAMMESVLRASGFKTGLYTSPHLFRFNERFRINGREIPDPVLEKLIAQVEAAAQSLTIRPPTFFEISTAMAFEYFNREKVDYAVIETGMGGRWDATNVIQPVLSVITRIDIDHTDYLGAEIEKIAWEKAGIIKSGAPVICGPMPVEAEAIVYKEAAEKKVPILGSDEAVFFQCLERRRDDQLLDIEASGHEYPGVRLPLAGKFQIENCGIAVAALEDLADLQGFRLQMKRGLESVKWPGRFQLLQEKPPVIYDGAHNVSGSGALLQALEEIFPKFENGFCFSFMKDKDVEGILKTLQPIAGKAWALTLPGDRAMKAEAIVENGRRIGLEITPVESPQPAIEWAEAGKKRLVCFTGSLYLPEELKKAGLFR